MYREYKSQIFGLSHYYAPKHDKEILLKQYFTLQIIHLVYFSICIHSIGILCQFYIYIIYASRYLLLFILVFNYYTLIFLISYYFLHLNKKKCIIKVI